MDYMLSLSKSKRKHIDDDDDDESVQSMDTWVVLSLLLYSSK